MHTQEAVNGDAASVTEFDVDNVSVDDEGTPAISDADGLDGKGKQPFRLTAWTLGWMVLIRTILVPGVQYLLVFFVAGRLLSGPDAKLAQLVLFLQSITPVSNILVVIAQKGNRFAIANGIAQSVLPQYVVASVSLTIFTALSLAETFPA